MAPAVESTKFAQDVELWLASPARRALVAALLTAFVAGVTTLQVVETLHSRNRSYEWDALYVQQVCLWAPWGLLGGPMVYLARWIFRVRRSWLFAAAVQAPLSVSFAYLFKTYEEVLANVVFQGTWLAPSRQVGEASFRFTRELLVYWLVLATGAAVYSFLRSQQEERRSAEARLREAQLAGEVSRAQLDTLRSQLHPHFLFNALHSVGGLVRADEKQRALAVLASIASLLRQTLDRADAQEVTLAEEIDLARRYLDIERIRFGERLAVEIEVEPEAEGANVPALFLLTLVENAVRHGVAPRVEGGKIAVRARVHGARVEIVIEDDGPGIPEEVRVSGQRAADASGLHIGLANTRRRLELLYGAEQALALEQRTGGGARVRVEVPLRPASVSPAPQKALHG